MKNLFFLFVLFFLISCHRENPENIDESLRNQEKYFQKNLDENLTRLNTSGNDKGKPFILYATVISCEEKNNLFIGWALSCNMQGVCDSLNFYSSKRLSIKHTYKFKREGPTSKDSPSWSWAL